jgi:hypothetical protein
MSQCHDLYDTVAPHGRRLAVPAVATQCHDGYPASVPEDDDEPAPQSEPAPQLENA